MKKSFKKELGKTFEKRIQVFNSAFQIQLFENREFREIGIRIFGDIENFRLWLETPNPSFGDKKPAEYLGRQEGTELIQNALEALSWGNYI